MSLPPLAYRIEENVDITRQTTLERLFVYRPNTVVEYPETSVARKVGHLFELDPDNWINPATSFAYSQGEPRGRSGPKKPLYCKLLVDKDGQPVPCSVSHSTCQGCKVCPFADLAVVRRPHTTATREDLVRHIDQQRRVYQLQDSPARDVFVKTLSFWSAFQKLGCTAPRHEATSYLGDEQVQRERRSELLEKIRRGHEPKETCDGRLVFEYDRSGRAFVRCEHFSRQYSPDHLVSYEVSNGLYDTDYLEALFTNNTDEIQAIEEEARAYGFGPLVSCNTVSNFSSVKVDCPAEHRSNNGHIMRAEIMHVECKSKFRVYEPWEVFRRECPKIMVVCSGQHDHPLPLPTKTPPSIRSELLKLLKSLEHDLPDLTPRRFLRHPAVCAYIHSRLPDIVNPQLSDLHSSLANRDHLRAYITQAQAQCYPKGTGWAGVIHAKELQDRTLPPQQHYIRIISETSLTIDYSDDSEDHTTAASEAPFRFVLCMTPEASHRLLHAQYLQSDISFKRIAGWQEFALGGLDRASRTAIAYCRIYLTRQTAKAHQLIFAAIESVVKQDTGQTLKWRHIHANSADEYSGILHWGGDQHGGQAKGLGMHLQKVVQQMPPKVDLHEPHRLLTDLTDYEHLHRFFRLCDAHAKRNIQKVKGISESVKNKMRSLACVEHDDWDGTLRAIEQEGGKAGSDWVHDKVRSKFAFEGICWEKSHIPKVVWQAGDATTNGIEGLHADVNLEGLSCTLLGGLKKGEHYDGFKMKTLRTLELTGIRPSYERGHISVSAVRNLKRKGNIRHKVLVAQDVHISKQNNKLRKTRDALDVADARLQQQQGMSADVILKATRTRDTAKEAYEKEVAASVGLAGSGTGKLGLLLPPSAAVQAPRNLSSF